MSHHSAAVTPRSEGTSIRELVEHDLRVALPEQRREPPGRRGFTTIEQSAFREQERPNAGRGDLGALAMPFQKLRLGLPHVRPRKGWNQNLGRAPRQRRNDHPVGLQVRRDRPNGHGKPVAGTHMPPNANDRDIEAGRSAHRLDREFVGERKRVEGDGEPRIEQTLKREHRDPHGVFDLKVGVYACTSFR